jgi:glucans biosynthesis protein
MPSTSTIPRVPSSPSRGSTARLRSLPAPCLRASHTLLLLIGTLIATRSAAFGFDDVARRAQQLSAAAYKAPEKALPKALSQLTYDQYRDIRYRRDKNLWADAGLPFEIAFFHTGFHFEFPVRIHQVDAYGTHDVEFQPALFDYGANKLDPSLLREGGFAGFRVHYAINTPRYKDEVLVFLGASYFRALGRGQIYGASARGIAIDTAAASGEEFPRFVEFWILRPAVGARALTIFALLDSPRATGAYQFVLRPGIDTLVDVKARVFLRDSVAKLGMAPLTSMFYFGENQRPANDDFRPEVHDSDGLSIHTAAGEWIFRPLVNPKRLLVSSFQVTDPAGFGLSQRDRNFDHYEDLEARYDRRPTVWIEPAQKWGPGRVELVLLPTPNEWNDNIVAYWVPAAMPAPKQPYDFGYRMSWQREPETRSPQSWVVQTRRGLGDAKERESGVIGFVIDFVGPALKDLPADVRVDAVVSTNDNGKIREQVVQRNEVSGGYRVVLRLQRVDADKPVELRMFLRSGDRTLSETWSYLLPPES